MASRNMHKLWKYGICLNFFHNNFWLLFFRTKKKWLWSNWSKQYHHFLAKTRTGTCSRHKGFLQNKMFTTFAISPGKVLVQTILIELIHQHQNMSQSNTQSCWKIRPGSDVMTGKFFLFLMKHDWFLIAERQIPNCQFVWCHGHIKTVHKVLPHKFPTSHIPKGGLEPPSLWLGKATELCNRFPIQNVHRTYLLRQF